MKIHKISPALLLAGLLLTTLYSHGQYIFDAYTFSKSDVNGTARFQAIGGSHVSLGGDGGAISGNPAGLGFYSRSEISISPGIQIQNTSTDYIGFTTKDSKSSARLPNFSLVLGGGGNSNSGSKWKKGAFGISYNQSQSFRDQFSYSGLNNQSAFIDNVVEQANNFQLTETDLNAGYQTNSDGSIYINSLAGAYYNMYAFNPTDNNGVLGPPYVAEDSDKSVDQAGTYSSRGQNSQWTFAYGANYDNKLYLGISIGLNRVRYSYDHNLDDRLINASVIANSRFSEALDVNGNGFNATLGAIYRVIPAFQLGLSVSTPTFTNLNESYYQAATVNPVVPDNLPTHINVYPNDFEYRLQSPLKASLGFTYFPGTQKIGFVTVSADYVGYAGMRVRAKGLSGGDLTDFNYNNGAEAMKETYKNVINLRVGAEIRAGIARLRVGTVYMPDPYKVKYNNIDRKQLIFTAGAGIKAGSLFVDLAANFRSFNSAFTPYTMDDSSRYFTAITKNTPTNIVLTLGKQF